MKVMNAVDSMLGILAVLMLGAGAAGNARADGLSQARAADCVSPATDSGEYHVVHAIWQRPSWAASRHVPRDSNIWM
jgi:hypothetical protein